MSEQTYQMLAIVLYFAAMLGIGYYAYRKTANLSGYMLAERGLRPSVAALSANASDMSGWLLMGLPGAIYSAGLVEAWIAIGLTVGAWLNWKFVAPRLRAYTEIADDAITIPSFFAKRLKGNARPLRIAAAVVILVFFDAHGMPKRAEIAKSSGFDRLDQAALSTVQRWRYVPGKRGGVPEAMWFNVPLQFVLD